MVGTPSASATGSARDFAPVLVDAHKISVIPINRWFLELYCLQLFAAVRLQPPFLLALPLAFLESTMLTDTAVKNAKLSPPRKISDSAGLYLEITATGSKLWRVAYRFQGKQRTLYVKGAYPAVSLADARSKRDKAKELLAKGIDPNDNKREVIRERASKIGFADLANEWFEGKIKKEGKAENTINELERHKDFLCATIGHLDAGLIEPANVLAAIKAKQDAGHHGAAQRLRATASRIFQYGIPKGYCKRDQAADISGAMVEPSTKPRPALTEPTEFGRLLRDIEAHRGHLGNVSGLAMKLLPLVATRPYQEFALAEWGEIDFEQARWTIPKARMKVRDAEERDGRHMVPLSRQALAIFKQLHDINGDCQYVFAVSRDQPLGRNTIGKALRALGYEGKHCAHGFRSSFSTMLNKEYRDDDENQKVWHNDVIELQLAHLEGNTRAIYRRFGPEALWKQRQNLMQHWADRCDSMKGDNVVAIKLAA